MSCFSKEKKLVRKHELAFMSICTEGAFNKKDLFDAVLENAVKDGQTEQIWEAKDDDNDLPLHRAAENGNPTAMQWIFDKWDEQGIPLEADTLDHNGYTSLYLVCYKGFLGSDGLVGMT